MSFIELSDSIRKIKLSYSKKTLHDSKISMYICIYKPICVDLIKKKK